MVTIQEAREAKGMTQRQLADAIGSSFWAVSSWERGVRMPAADTFQRLARVLGVPMEQFRLTDDGTEVETEKAR